jgi:hypothetical protein
MDNIVTRTLRPLIAAFTTFALALSAGAASAQEVRWEPDFAFPGTIFPSFAISSAGMDEKGPTETATAYGYLGSGELVVKITLAPAGVHLKVQVAVPELGILGEIEPPSDGKARYVVPRLSWTQSRLVSIVQPQTSEAVFRVFADDKLMGEERRPVRVRAINDVPLRACRTPQQCRDFSPFMAAFVNENHPVIDGILRSALDIPAMPVKQWIGTQGTQDDVLRQVWAIWYLFQRHNVTYSSITTVSDTRDDLLSQTVRPLSQALRTQQANCIDGTVLFASILRKIGIEPLIVLIPHHAFLGFYTDPQQQKPMFLETTMLNSAENPFHERGPSKGGADLARALGSDIHAQKSWQSFVSAMNRGQQEYDMASPSFGKAPGFMVIPVAKARQAGILPLPL